MDDDRLFRTFPTWALDMQARQKETADWATQKRAQLADTWAKEKQTTFATNLAALGYDLAGEYVGVASDPTFDVGQRYLGPEGATPADVANILPPGELPSLGQVGSDALGVLSAPAQVARAGFPVPGEDSNLSPGQKIAQQGLAGSNEGFERTLDLGAQVDPTGGYLAGGASTAARLGTDPLTTIGGVGGRAAQAGGVLGGVAGAGYSAATGASPTETAQNVETGANLGMAAGPILQGLGNLVRRSVPAERAEVALSSPEAFQRVAADLGFPDVQVTDAQLALLRARSRAALDTATAPGGANVVGGIDLDARATSRPFDAYQDFSVLDGRGQFPSEGVAYEAVDNPRAFVDLKVPGAPASSRSGPRRPISLNSNREVAGGVAGALKGVADTPEAPPQQEGESDEAYRERLNDYWQQLGVNVGTSALGGAGLAAFTRPGVRKALMNTASEKMGIIPSSPFNDPNLAKIEGAYNTPLSKAAAPAGQRLEQAFTAFRRAFTDADAPLEVWQRRAEKAYGGPLPPDLQAYYLNRLNPNRAAEVNIQDGLRPAIQAVGDDRTKLDTYLTLWDNVDQAAATGNPNRKFAFGLTAADSQAGLTALRQEVGPQRAQQIEDAAQQVWDFGKSLLQKKLDAGIIDQALFNDLTAKYPHYVPTRILDYLKDKEGLAIGRSLSLNDSGLRRLTLQGSDKPREMPLASMIRYAYDAESAVMKNNAARGFLEDGRVMGMVGTAQAPIPGGINPVPAGYTPKRGEGTLTLFENGVKQSYAMPADVAAAVNREGVVDFPAVNNAMALFKMMATSRNPAFLIGNAAIDVPSYMTRTLAREGGSPTRLPGITMDLIKGYWDALQGITTGTYKGTTADFLREGGGQSGFFSRSESSARQSLDDLSRKNVFQVRSAADIKRIAKDVLSLKPVEGIGERIELGPRVAAYNRALKQGKNVNEAVINGRTVTLDFNQGGTFIKTLNQFIPFFNVGVQGAMTLPRTLRENQRGAMAAAGSMVVAPTLAAEVWNHATPERAADYANVPEWVKNQGVVVMLPGEAPTNERGERGPQYVLIRLREYTPIVIATREVTDRVMGQESNRDGWDLLAAGLSQTTPIQGPSQLMFPGAATAVQLAADRDLYTGQHIATRFNDERASPISQAGADAINAGAALIGRYPDVRPSQVEFGTRNVATGIASAAHGLANALGGAREGSELPQDIPVAGGVIGRFVGSRTGGDLERAQKDNLPEGIRESLYEMGLRPDVGNVRSEIDGVPLNRQEAAAYQNIANREVASGLRDLLRDPRFHQSPPGGKAMLVQREIEAAHTRARAAMTERLGPAMSVRKDRAERRAMAGSR